MVTLFLLGALLLVWQFALQAFAWGLGSRLHWAERLAACTVVLVLCAPWIVHHDLFLPLDETIARNVPGAVLPAVHDVHGAYNDVVLQLYPWESEVRAALRAGRLPFWSDLLDGGSSPWSNPQTAVLAPSALLARLGPLDQFFLLHFALKVLTAILGALLLARRLGLGRLAAWVAALSFGLGGGVIAWSLFPLGTVVAWMPWLALAGIAIARRPWRNQRRVFLTAALLAAAAALSGHPESAIAAGFVSLAAAFLTFRRRSAGSQRLARTAAITAFWLLGAALAAPVLVPQALQVTHSLRATRAADRSAQAKAGPAPDSTDFGGWFPGGQGKLFLAPLNPEVFGRAFHEAARAPIPWPVLGSCYLGVLLLLGLPGAFLSPRRRRLALPLVALAALVYLLAAGFAPLAQGSIRLPYVDAIAFNRWLPAAGLGLLLAGALGLEAILRRERGWKIALGASVALALLILLLAHPLRLVVVLALALAALAVHGVRGMPARALLVAAVLLDLIPWAWDYLPVGHREMLYPVTPFVGALAQQMEQHSGARVTAAGFLIYPSLLPAYGFPEVRVNNPAADADYLRVLDACLGFRPESVRYKGAVKNPDHPILSFLGVAVLIAGDHTPQPARWKRLDQGQLAPLRLYENPNPLPRWFLPIGTDVVPAASRLAAVATIADPRRVVLSADDARGWQPSIRPWRPFLLHARGEPGRVHLDFPGDAKKLVASSLPFSAGWKATSGGRPMSTIRIDAAFLGLVAEPGTTSADVRFEPPGFRLGLALSAVALLLAGIVAWMPYAGFRARARR
jgi:hypothetical protein